MLRLKSLLHVENAIYLCKINSGVIHACLRLVSTPFLSLLKPANESQKHKPHLKSQLCLHNIDKF